MQELKPLDHLKRRDFGEWAFKSKIFFIVEAHFWLNVYINNQKLQIFSEKILQEIFYVLPYSFKLSFCCAIWADGVIGPYFLKAIPARMHRYL